MTSGKPNDRMCLNTSELSQIGFANCSDVFGDVSKVLGGFFVSSETVNHPKAPPVERSRTRRSRTSIRRRFLGRVCLYAEIFRGPFFNNNHNMRSW